MKSLRIVTRKSPLAMWQAEFVQEKLKAAHPQIDIEILGITTDGDRWLDKPLMTIGGKGLFVKELEQALLNKEADIAVHSMKDVPAIVPDGLTIGAVLSREIPNDTLVSTKVFDIYTLPQQAVVGTSSLRRACQIKHLRKDVEIQSLRGNVNTRLKKLDSGKYDAIILADCGLKRLGITGYHQASFAVTEMIPAVGQGILGIECRAHDEQVLGMIACLHDNNASICLSAERAMNAKLAGNCQAPIAGYAILEDTSLILKGMVGDPDTNQLLKASASGPMQQAEGLGVSVADDLLVQGAGPIIAALKKRGPKR